MSIRVVKGSKFYNRSMKLCSQDNVQKYIQHKMKENMLLPKDFLEVTNI